MNLALLSALQPMLPEQIVYIVDDDEAVRDSLSALLEAKGYTVGTFAYARDFLAVARTLRVGVLITDMQMPGMDGLELQQHLIERSLRYPLIVITGHGDVPLAVRAMKAGAVDFIEKPFAPEVMLDSIAATLARFAMTAGMAEDRAAVSAAALLAALSPREREVLEGLLSGLPNKSIAYDLGISPRTVEIHRARVMDKMGARSLSELIRMGLAAGMQPDRRS